MLILLVSHVLRRIGTEMKTLSGQMFSVYVFTASLGWLIHGVKEMMIMLLFVSFVRLFIGIFSSET